MTPAGGPAGYSGTPLPKKLGIREGMTVSFIGAPDHFTDLLEPMPLDVAIRHDARALVDVAVFFTVRRSLLERRIGTLERIVFPDGSLWVAWPKRASGVPTDMTEDAVRDVVLPRGLVDIKVAAIDDVWSGLRVVHRRVHR